MPGSMGLLQQLRAGGIAAVLSGAGPSVLALGRDLPEPESLSGSGFRARAIDLSTQGARVDPA